MALGTTPGKASSTLLLPLVSFLLDGGPKPRTYKGQGKRSQTQDTQGRLSHPEIQMFQSEVMLLLVTLALLGTPTFGAQKYYGSTVGTHFCTVAPSGENITAIRIAENSIRLLSVQVKYGETWSDVYGVRGGTIEEISLYDGEHITSIYGSHLTNIRSIVMYTDWPRFFFFGQRVSQEFTAFPDKPDQVLKGFCGFYQIGGLKSLRFEWGDP